MVASTPTAFARAVAEHPFPTFEIDRVPLAAALADAGMLVVGEPHGVRETPSVLFQLALELGTRAVAFEWSHEEMDAPLHAFLSDGTFDFDALWSLPPTAEFFCGDGRITAGHFALLRRLRDAGLLDQVIAFDRLDAEPPREWAAHVAVREPELARRLLAEWNGHTPLLVLTGAFHARLASPDGEPMAAHLARRVPRLRPAMLQYSGRPMPAASIVIPAGAATPAVVPGCA